MKVSILVTVILLGVTVAHQIENIVEDQVDTRRRGISKRAAIDRSDTCLSVVAFPKTFCSDSNPCLAGNARASKFTCTGPGVISPLETCPAATRYCSEPNPRTTGGALCTATRPFGCDAIDALECSAAPGKKFCLNNNPCITPNSIRQCDANINVKVSALVTDCTSAGFIGCMETMGGDPKCIKQVSSYCPDAETFICTGQGFYPNAFNCRQYFQCIATDSKALAKECQAGHVFNPMANKNENPCKPSNGKNCIESTCGIALGGGNQILDYPGFLKSYGSYAVACGGQQPKVYRCEDGFEPNLQVNPITCTGRCPGNNKRASDPANPNGYYMCSFNGAKYIGSRNECLISPILSGLFNKAKKVCQ